MKKRADRRSSKNLFLCFHSNEIPVDSSVQPIAVAREVDNDRFVLIDLAYEAWLQKELK